jgi:hypothetical protein
MIIGLNFELANDLSFEENPSVSLKLESLTRNKLKGSVPAFNPYFMFESSLELKRFHDNYRADQRRNNHVSDLELLPESMRDRVLNRVKEKNKSGGIWLTDEPTPGSLLRHFKQQISSTFDLYNKILSLFGESGFNKTIAKIYEIMMGVIGKKENLYPFRSDLWYIFNFTEGDESDYVFIQHPTKNWITGSPAYRRTQVIQN